MSNWRNKPSRPSNRGTPRAAARGTQSAAPPRRQMEHIASVSRSSGLEKDGDTLKDFKVQEEYRVFLQGKVDDVFLKYPRKTTESDKEAIARVNAQENVLILFRKLREGISSSRRNDSLALEVYETSLHLAVVFESPKQTTAVIPHLVPSLYLNSPSPHKNRLVSVLISLLNHLTTAYPSQGTFRQFWDTIPTEFLPRNSAAYKWISSVAKSLRTQDYVTLEALSRLSDISKLLESTEALSRSMEPMPISQGSSESLSIQALHVLVHSLRNKAQATTWRIIRSAYREFSCNSEDTQIWLKRSLCLDSLVPFRRDITPEQWLEQQSLLGDTRQKEGVQGKWIIYKVQ